MEESADAHALVRTRMSLHPRFTPSYASFWYSMYSATVIAFVGQRSASFEVSM